MSVNYNRPRSVLKNLTLQTLVLLCVAGCASSDGLKGLGKKFPTLWGRLAAPPTLENHRLFLYVKVTHQEGYGEDEIIICVAENEEKAEILKRLAARVVESSEAGKPLALIGNPVRGSWQEYAEGIDFEIYAVGYFNPKGQKYQTVITAYGTRLKDLMGSISWGEFIKLLGKKAVNTAL